uniref:Uncharacterized protein LOC113799254 n=1 Tax=Dermatophagoides pteronyssinus TaxID=6956 RepID=A0A6P6YK76_DERPT|nr:uncharacterized protein LOC113799254 [Dermatophagoides pteronyssinus]
MSEIKTEHHVYQNDTDDDDDDMTNNPLTESKNIDDNDDGGGQIEKHRSEKQFKWFMHAYISVAITIIGILLVVIGGLLMILQRVRFTSDWSNSGVYLGKRIIKWSGETTTVVGIIIGLFGFIYYWHCLKKIDIYINTLQNKNDINRAFIKQDEHYE